MAIKQGDSVTNTKCPQWGTGLVISIGDNAIEVRFLEVGSKRLRPDVLSLSAELAPPFDKKPAKKAALPKAAKS